MALTVQTVVPQLFLFAEDGDPHQRKGLELEQSMMLSDRKRPQKQDHSMWNRLSLHKLGSWLKKEDNGEPPPYGDGQDPCSEKLEKSRFLGRRSSRKVVPGLPRPITFRRLNSEKRDRLCPNDLEPEERRAHSVDRRVGLSEKRSLSPPPMNMPSLSAPDVTSPMNGADSTTESFDKEGKEGQEPPKSGPFDHTDFTANSIPRFAPREPLPPLTTAGELTDHETVSEGAVDDRILQQELEAKWILNLSMHFRDMTDREKFFITYAEEPNKWRRVTVSCDYRGILPDSLEADLKSLHYQRDKSARIYESIRDSLPDIQFYPSVTNLKLQTADGRLHVHVTEDMNEIIPYPSTSVVSHLPGRRFHESAVSFDSHISGFVYKVEIEGRFYIKKEIPGPDTVEEFLYEVNALSSLKDSRSVIKYEGLVVDDKEELVKGVLISYAEKGALVDIIFDCRGNLPWARRELWARQIVEGLSEIHEAGFVQGDFTVSNIVINANDDAKIIDINRRGCPVGWEPPELVKLIENGQRISMYIGVKSDLFQLGMVLWALAAEKDEPEREERPLYSSVGSLNVPQYFKDMVVACLNDNPQLRTSAKDLLALFPPTVQTEPRPSITSRHSLSTHRSDKEYIDPATAVDLADIELSRQDHIGDPSRPSSISAEDLGFAEAGASSSYKISSSGSFVVARRGRARACVSPQRSTSASPSTSRGRRSYNTSRSPTAPVSTISLDDSDLEAAFSHYLDPIPREPRWERVYIDGDTQVVQRSSTGAGSPHEFDKEEQMAIDRLPTPPTRSTNDDLLDLSITPVPTHEQRESISTDTLTIARVSTPVMQTDNEPHFDEKREQAPSTPPQMLPSPFRASFHDRVQLRRSHDSTLADLEDEILNSSPKSANQRRFSNSNLENTEEPPPKIEPLRHCDSGFHEPTFNASGIPSRTTTFGPPSHMDSGFHTAATRAIGSASRSDTFGPPLHSDSGFDEQKSTTANVTDALQTVELQDGNSTLERSKEDELRVREAIRKIMTSPPSPKRGKLTGDKE